MKIPLDFPSDEDFPDLVPPSSIVPSPVSIALIAGSGILLEPLMDTVDETISFQAMGLPDACLPGHDYKFLVGRGCGCRLIIQCGRFHMYQGYDYETITRPVDCLKQLGAELAILTSAAGGLLPGLSPGDLVAVDRIRMCRYRKWSATPGVLVPDFKIAGSDYTGTYQWVPGPNYETRAEIAAVQNMGAAAIGMSAAPELMRCQELGLRVAHIACITNSCAKAQRLTHQAVITAAERGSEKLCGTIMKGLMAMTRDT